MATDDLTKTQVGITGAIGAEPGPAFIAKPDKGDWRRMPDPTTPSGYRMVNADTGEIGGFIDLPQKEMFEFYPDWYKTSAEYGNTALDVAILIDVGYSLAKLGIWTVRNAPRAFKAIGGQLKNVKFAHKLRKMPTQKILDSLGGHADGDPEIAKWFAGLSDAGKKAYIKGLKSDIKTGVKVAQAKMAKAPKAPKAKPVVTDKLIETPVTKDWAALKETLPKPELKLVKQIKPPFQRIHAVVVEHASKIRDAEGHLKKGRMKEAGELITEAIKDLTELSKVGPTIATQVEPFLNRASKIQEALTQVAPKQTLIRPKQTAQDTIGVYYAKERQAYVNKMLAKGHSQVNAERIAQEFVEKSADIAIAVVNRWVITDPKNPVDAVKRGLAQTQSTFETGGFEITDEDVAAHIKFYDQTNPTQLQRLMLPEVYDNMMKWANKTLGYVPPEAEAKPVLGDRGAKLSDAEMGKRLQPVEKEAIFDPATQRILDESGHLGIPKIFRAKEALVTPSTKGSKFVGEVMTKIGAAKEALKKQHRKKTINHIRQALIDPNINLTKALRKAQKDIPRFIVEDVKALPYTIEARMTLARGHHLAADVKTLRDEKVIKEGLTNAEYALYNEYNMLQRTIAIEEGALESRLAAQENAIVLKEELRILRKNLLFYKKTRKLVTPEGKALKKRVRQLQRAIRKLNKRAKREVKHPFGLSASDARDRIADYPADLHKEFDSRNEYLQKMFREELQRYVDAGLKTTEDFEAMVKTSFFLPRRYLHKMDPFLTYPGRGGKTLNVPASGGIKALGEGSFEALEMDTMRLVDTYHQMTEAVILKNNVYHAAERYAIDLPENGIFRVPGKGEAEKPPKGWAIIKGFRGGEQQALLIRDELAADWTFKDPLIQGKVINMISWITLTRPLKFMATGPGNPLWWASNIPMDIAHSYLAQTTYTKDIFRFTKDYMRNFAKGVRDIQSGGGVFKQYAESGGLDVYLSEEAAPSGITRAEAQRWVVAANYLNNAAEIGGHLSNTRAFAEELLRQKGIKNPEKLSWGEIKSKLTDDEVTRAMGYAKLRTEFSHPGTFWKIMDATKYPYSKAGFEALRKTKRAAEEKPWLFMWKLANMMVFAGGIFGARMLVPEEYDKFSAQTQINNYIIPIGLSSKDKDGNIVPVAIKIKKDPNMRFILTAYEQLLAHLYLNEPLNVDVIKEASTQMLPYVPGAGTAPLDNIITIMQTGIDPRTGNRVWKGPEFGDKTLEWDMESHPFWKWLGETTGQSPERLKKSSEQVATFGSPYAEFVGKATRPVFKDLPFKQQKSLVDKLLSMPGAKKIFVIGRPSHYKQIKEATEIDNETRFKIDRPFELALTGYSQGKFTVKGLNALIMKAPVEHRERLANKFKAWVRIDIVWKAFEKKHEFTVVSQDELLRIQRLGAEKRAIAHIKILEQIARVDGLKQAKFFHATTKLMDSYWTPRFAYALDKRRKLRKEQLK